ncbi:MAG: TlpA family protein disulfide reductase [Candidatus Brocadiae bacterium]|nr:TlpA family protein disulfide reductase [Candidatus Brocadiia bacterium]
MAASDRKFTVGYAAAVAVALVVMGGCVILATVLRRSGGPEGMLRPPPIPSAPYGDMDYDWTVRGLDGQDLNMADLKGKVVFLNIWATWCPPCRVEMPSIQRLYEELAPEGVVFVLASDEDAGTLRDFVRDNDFTLPVYSATTRPPPALETEAIPTTFIISPDGKIVRRHLGMAQWDHPDVVEFLRGLLQGGSARNG